MITTTSLINDEKKQLTQQSAVYTNRHIIDVASTHCESIIHALLFLFCEITGTYVFI